MTRFMLKTTLSLEGDDRIGLVLGQEKGHGFTQAVELKQSLRIGTKDIEEDQKKNMTVLIQFLTLKENGILMFATA